MKQNMLIPVRKEGYSLIEILVVVTVFLIFLGMVIINLTGIIPRAEINIDPYSVIGDIKKQQLRSMTGDSINGLPSAYGVYLEEDQYTLFAGDTYQAGSGGNAIVKMSENLSIINITFPDSSIVFSQIDGEINNFINGSNTFSIRNSVTNDKKTITFNKLGTVTGLE